MLSSTLSMRKKAKRLCVPLPQNSSAFVFIFFSLLELLVWIFYMSYWFKILMFQLNTFVLLMAIFGVFAIILSASLFLLDRPTRHLIVGFLTCASLISMFASPLFIIVSFFCLCNFLFVSVLRFCIILSYHLIIYANTIMLTRCIFFHRDWWFEQRVLNSCPFTSPFQHSRWVYHSCCMESSILTPSYMWVFIPIFAFIWALVLFLWVICLIYAPLFKFQVPNGIGTILGSVQLLLFLYYERKDTDHTREPLIESFP